MRVSRPFNTVVSLLPFILPCFTKLITLIGSHLPKKKSLSRVGILMGLCERWSYSTWLFGIFFGGEEGFEFIYNVLT